MMFCIRNTLMCHPIVFSEMRVALAIPDTEIEGFVNWQIEEAASKLGFALATLNNWYDDPEE